MFETTEGTMDLIPKDLIFHNRQISTELNNEIDKLLLNTTMYGKTNSNKSSEYIIKRPDVTITLNILKEIMKKGTYLKYLGVNLPNALGNTFEISEEDLINSSDERIKRILSNMIDYAYHTDYIAQSTHFNGSIVFANAIKGASFLTKFKKVDISKASTENYTVERLKDLELELMEGRFDSTIVLKITNNFAPTHTYFVLTNKHSWYKIRKMTSKILDLYPEEILEGLNETFVNKIRFLCEKLGAEGNDNSAWQETLFSILTDEERKNQQMIIDIQKLLENTKRDQENEMQQIIRRYKSDISSYEQQVRNRYEQIREYEGKLLKLEQDPEIKQKLLETLEFVNKSKLIKSFIINPDNKKVKVVIEAPIRYFDQNYAKAVYKNINSTGNYHRQNDCKVFKQLFEDLFLTEKYTLMTTTIIDIFFYYNGASEPLTYSIIRASRPDRYIGQPHLDGYACLGNNQIEARKLCANFDLLGLVALFTNCAQNFNLTDSAVFSHFKENILSSYDHLKTLRNNETGEEISFYEYYTRATGKALTLPEVIATKEKYANYTLTDKEIAHLFKAFKSLKEITVPANLALVLARLANAEHYILNGNANSPAFYNSNENEDKAITLTMVENRVYAEALSLSYFHALEIFLKQNNNGKTTCYTTLLNEYEEQTVEAATNVPEAATAIPF